MFFDGVALGHYHTICADPPWHYDSRVLGWGQTAAMPYSTMQVDEIAAMPVAELARADCHLYLWTTNRYLRDAFDIVAAWGFRYSQTLVWCKPPAGKMPGTPAFSNTSEYVLLARHGRLAHTGWFDSTWFEAPRAGHSAKPPAFYDMVEQVSPGPYLELFCRQPRLGWDSWGYGYEGHPDDRPIESIVWDVDGHGTLPPPQRGQQVLL